MSRQKMKQQRAITGTILIIVLVFCISYSINYLFIGNYIIYTYLPDHSLDLPPEAWDLLEMLWYLLINLNSVFNPVIYLVRNTFYKAAMREFNTRVRALFIVAYKELRYYI